MVKTKGMYTALVPSFFTIFHTFRSFSEGITTDDEEISVIGLIMIVLVSCIEIYVNKMIAWIFVLPPLILVTIGPLYQKLRYNNKYVRMR